MDAKSVDCLLRQFGNISLTFKRYSASPNNYIYMMKLEVLTLVSTKACQCPNLFQRQSDLKLLLGHLASVETRSKQVMSGASQNWIFK